MWVGLTQGNHLRNKYSPYPWGWPVAWHLSHPDTLFIRGDLWVVLLKVRKLHLFRWLSDSLQWVKTKPNMPSLPSVHKVDKKTGPEEQMDKVGWSGLETIEESFVTSVQVLQKPPLQLFYLWRWSQCEGLLSHCFHCILRKWNGWKHPLQRGNKGTKGVKGLYCVRVMTCSLSW